MKLVILYGLGGLSDVGRHAIQAALEKSEKEVSKIVVMTTYPELLKESNWNCGCEHNHSFTKEDEDRMEIVPIQSWKDKTIVQTSSSATKNNKSFESYFEGAHAVISCLGNRQAFLGGWESAEGNQAVIDAVEKTNGLSRVVVITSVGIEEDWPAMENFFMGKVILSGIFWTIGRPAFKDLTNMERAYRRHGDTIDYHFVRPVGIGEDIKPTGTWYLQKQKYNDPVEINMAKLDVARYMVEEALNPTRHRDAVVIAPCRK